MSLTVWPPLLADLKIDAQIPADDTRDDEALQQVLDAAVEFVEDRHGARYNFADESGSDLPAPPLPSMGLGTCRLAYRWHVRRRSPDALVSMGEMGSARVPTFDPDIDRMLRIGRYSPPVIA